MTRALLPAKLKATGIHLLISGSLFLGVLYLILQHWYPGLWFMEGGWQGVRIMIAVDLVLGPALTFVVFNPAKTRRALRFDFGLIGLTQLCAFVWGVYAVHAQRPVAIVFWEDAFHSIEERALAKQGKTLTDLRALDLQNPALIFAQEPKTSEEVAQLVQLLFTKELAEYEQAQLFQPLPQHLDDVFSRSEAIFANLDATTGATAALDAVLAEHVDAQRQDLRLVSFIGRYEEATLVFRPDGRLIGTLPYINPKKGVTRSTTG